jgi:Tol biopolymer transport system component
MALGGVGRKEKPVDAARSRRIGPLELAPAAVLLVAAALAALSVALLAAQEPARATFPGENGNIAFVAHDGKNGEEIYTVSPSGARPKQLTRGESHKQSPAWSADGRRIAFVKVRDPTLHGDIYTMRANGTDQAVVTRTLSDDSDPSWSPDGRRLVFLRNVTEDRPEIGEYGDRDIFVVDRDGTDLVRLTRTPEVSELDPVWSPDGTEIAFSTFTFGEEGGPFGGTYSTIYTMKAEGSEPPEEVLSVEGGAFDLSWSPDGQWFAYNSPCGGGDCLWKVRVDGTQPTFLTVGQCGPRTCHAFNPEWSPDGEQIAFDGLHMIDANGENMRSIGVSGSQPSWRPVVR